MSLKQYIKRGVKYVLTGQPVVYTTANIVTIAPSQQLSEKRILVTGGSKGIGLAMAQKFVAEGAKVMITGRNRGVLRSVADELGCLYWCMDVTKSSALRDEYKLADERIGGFNCLVNNAGISLHEKSFFDVTVDQFDSQFSTNLKGGYFLTQLFTETCRGGVKNNGKVIFISSQRGAFVDDIPYGLTKATINSLVQGLAYDLIEYGIRVYGLAPGATLTDLIGEETNGNLHYEINRSKRLYLPEEVAEVGAFLLTDVANCLSGNILVCDEGRSINSYKKK
ncbi:MAG: SDR family oxidoreductase [Bacteroidales bacterium]|nr:SDR family oxidoreductase [Bacteroidales bacterium]